MSKVNAVTDATWQQEVEQHSGLTVVDFWAAWCGPCRMIAPIVEQLAEDYAGKAKVLKLDSDANQQTTIRQGVRGLPTLQFFRDGKLVDQIVGAMPRSAIEAKLRAHLEAAPASA